MELTWIDDFIALDRTQNFTLAAQQRCTTQSAFSRRIRSMEDWFECILFDRNVRPVALTKSGIECKKRIYRLRDDMMDMRRISNLATSHLPDNSSVVCTTNTIAVGFLPDWLGQLKLENYRLVVSSVSHALEMARQGQCSHTIVPKFDFWSDPLFDESEIIFQDKLVFASSSQDQYCIKNGEVIGDVLMYSPKTALGQAVDNMLGKASLKIRDKPKCESASAEAIVAQIKSGVGSGWVVDSLLSDVEKEMLVHNDMPSILFDICLIVSR
jgi:DNA-binding transcriptional LysR family regulator